MTKRQSDRIISLLEKMAFSFQIYMRDLRIQIWLKSFFLVLLIAAGGYFFWKENLSGKVISRKVGSDSTCSTAANQILVVRIEGEISEYRRGMVERVKDTLRLAAENQKVKAVILLVQSPGGEVNASDLIWNEVVKFKKSKKPVVAFFNGLAASGGYYVSTPADKIIATPETITGSIGVIMQSSDYSGLMRKIGVKQNVIKSGPQKDMLSPYRPIDPEARKIVQKIINGAYNRFVKKVAEGRKMSEKDVRAIADGRVYDADEALNNSLIDEIGYIEDALALAKSLAGVENASLTQYVKEKGILEDIFAKIDLNLLPSIGKSLIEQKQGLYYLWYPWIE